jgi:cytoskeletal protein CcmA (bactofilin family)
MGVFKKEKVGVDQQAISTLISEGSVIEGNLKAQAYARIDGHITGDVAVEEGLILGEKGIVDGNVKTKDMVVYGTVNGKIDVHSIEVKATGKITGDIRTGTLLVEPGGVYNGHMIMTTTADRQ